MLASLVMAIAVPQAFGECALAFAAGYVALHVVRNSFIVATTRPESPLHVAFRRICLERLDRRDLDRGALLDGEGRTFAWLRRWCPD
jgi:hypothetical protein